MPTKFHIILLMTIALIFAAPAHADIHKWVDANGITHYSDKAPNKRKSTTLNYGKSPVKRAPKKRAAPVKKTSSKAKRAASSKRTARKTQPKPATRKQAARSAVITDRSGRKQVVKSARKAIKAPIAATVAPASTIPRESTPELKPNLDAAEYDFREATNTVKKKSLPNVKQKLCLEKRVLLAALQEKGFNGYYDDEGHYRLAWGGDGIYQGKRRYLSEADIAKKTTKVMFEVEQYCDDPHSLTLQGDARAHWIRSEYCELGKAVLEDLLHPFMRSTDDAIEQQAEKVERLCTALVPGEYRDDERYYPTALQPKVVLPRHLTLVEDEETKIKVAKLSPEEILKQLLSIID